MRAQLAVLSLALLACGGGSPAPRAAESPRRARHAARRDAGARPIVGEYRVHYDAKGGDLRVEARFVAGVGAALAVESGAGPFVRDLESSADAEGARWVNGARSGRTFTAPSCGSGPCRVRYRYALREAARRIDDLDVASDEGAAIEAPPSTWLLAPEGADLDARVRFRVSTSEGARFVTGVFPSRAAEDAWDITLDDLWTSPYSAFGPFRVRTIESTGATIDVAVAEGKLTVTDDEIEAWTRDSARAVSTYFGRFPMPSALVIVVPGRGRWVGDGRTLAGGGGSIFMRVGERAPASAFREDWVLVHEMTHLAFPSVARQHDWAEEGLATYVEPFARVRAGTLDAEEAWRGLVEGLPNGLPASGDQGLDRTPTWGRTYWGGALFYFLADIEIRKRTDNRMGLEHALRGILAAGGSNAQRWSLEEAFAAGDAATGVPVLRELHAAMGTSPHPVDLGAVTRALGVSVSRGRVRFDDSAPLANVRRAITNGT